MAMAIKPDTATVIKRECLTDFLYELSKNKISKDYWDACRETRNYFSNTDIEKMKEMINGNCDK